MKKYSAYIIGGLIALAVIALFITGNNQKKKTLDERITLQRRDKIPYGTYVAYNSLEPLFPAAKVYTSRLAPGYWDSISNYDRRQAYFVVTDKFSADEEELENLLRFVKNGNDVFISAKYFSSAADEFFGCSSSSYDVSFYPDAEEGDTLRISLRKLPYEGTNKYSYPGKGFYSYFDQVDTATTVVLGYDEKGRPNFIQLKAGQGNFYLHSEPFAFTNYFLLHKKNISYYEKALAVIDPAVNKIVWDEYYLNKKMSPQKKKGWMSVLMQFPGLRAALLTAIFTLLLYVLLEMRRKQRYIPVVKKPKNDSLEFVKTIGRLYYDKGDHKNLGRKMTAYFLEYVRTKYKLLTGNLNEEFITNLKYKSGADETTIREIVGFIGYIETESTISSGQITDFHKKLNAFYKQA